MRDSWSWSTRADRSFKCWLPIDPGGQCQQGDTFHLDWNSLHLLHSGEAYEATKHAANQNRQDSRWAWRLWEADLYSADASKKLIKRSWSKTLMSCWSKLCVAPRQECRSTHWQSEWRECRWKNQGHGKSEFKQCWFNSAAHLLLFRTEKVWSDKHYLLML